MKDVTGRTLTSGDRIEIERMNRENAEAAKSAPKPSK